MNRSTLAVLALVALTGGAHALVFTTSFEASPVEAPGWDSTDASNEFAVNGWSTGTGTGANVTPGFNARTVAQGASVKSGNQSVQFLATSNSASRLKTSKSGFNTGGGATSYMRVSSSVNVDNAGSGIGRMLGLWSESQGWRAYLFKSANGQVQFATRRADNFAETIHVATGLSTNSWYRVELEMVNMGAGNGSVYAYLDGQKFTVATGLSASALSVQSTAGLLADVRGSGVTGKGWFDDFELRNEPVPEPATLLAAAVALVALRRRR